MTPRALLVADLRETVNPALRSWGFANPPKGAPERVPTTRLQAWWRTRQGFKDEIYFSWTQDTPTFWIKVRTDQSERMSGPCSEGLLIRDGFIEVVAYGRVYLRGFIDMRVTEFADAPMFPDPVPVALQRLEVINRYLLTGEHNSRAPRWLGG
jgi:hypothetical protein